MTRKTCGWLWLHDRPAYLRSDNGRDHACVRPPGHPARHSCWCGEQVDA
jgi:hypothetical protein